MRKLIQKHWPNTSCSEDVRKLISSKDLPALAEGILLGKVPLRIALMNDFFGQGDIILNEATLRLEAAGGRVVIASTLTLAELNVGDIAEPQIRLDNEIMAVPECLSQTLKNIARCAWARASILSHNESSELINHGIVVK